MEDRSEIYENEDWQDGFEVGYENGLEHAGDSPGYYNLAGEWIEGEYEGSEEETRIKDYMALNEDAGESEDDEDEEDYRPWSASDDDEDEESENGWGERFTRLRQRTARAIGEVMDEYSDGW